MSSENKKIKLGLRDLKSALFWAIIIELLLYAVTLYTSIMKGFHSTAAETIDSWTHFFGHSALSLVGRLTPKLPVDPLLVTTIIYFAAQIIVFFVASLLGITLISKLKKPKEDIRAR